MKNIFTLANLENIDILNNSINNELISVMFITIIFVVCYYSVYKRKYRKTNNFPLYSLLFVVCYVISVLLFVGESYVYFLLILYIVYLIIYKSFKKPKFSITNLIGKDYFDFKEKRFDDPDLVKKCFEIFKVVTYSWSNCDMYPAKEVMSDELYSIYDSQINSLYIKDQRNVMRDLELVKAKVKEVVKNNGKDIVVVVMEVKCRDYLIHTVDNTILKGHPSFLMDYIYELTFYRTKEEKRNNVCPKCKAILPNKSRRKTCQYCNEKIVTYNYKYILCKKNLLKQSAKKD